MNERKNGPNMMSTMKTGSGIPPTLTPEVTGLDDALAFGGGVVARG